MLCHVYILYSESRDRYYVGYTCDDLQDRVKRHRQNNKGFTGKTPDWELKYSEKFDDPREARTRERAIKKQKSRALIEQLIDA